MARVKLTIDGRSVEVEEGKSVLDAARAAGIHVPTLCFVEELEPSASCYLCAVQIEGRANLTPSCAMPAQNGMVVTTDSEDIRASRKMALELLLSDHAGDCVAPCSVSCPADLDIPGFLHPLSSGDSRTAMEIVSNKLFLPGALGRICPRLCERDCRRGLQETSLGIGALHRAVADRDALEAAPYRPRRANPSGRSVGIVGAGPAGLTAAYYLLARGHECTLYDAHERPGGMLRYGIPEYRLPRAALDREISVLEEWGAEFRMGVRLGKDVTFAELRERHDAVFLAIGAQRSRALGCPGDELAISGTEFLERVAAGDAPEVGERVVVVGGGNTAMDAARTAVRLGARSVVVLYRRTRAEMPCLMEEVVGAEEEGVTLEVLALPDRLERNATGRIALHCKRTELGEADASGRRSAVVVEGSEFTLEVDTVIAALGQSVELELATEARVAVTRWGLEVEATTLATNLPGVFAGGDAVSGPGLAVHAVAAGRIAATSIDQYLHGEPVVGERRQFQILMRALSDAERAALFRSIDAEPAAEPAVLEPAQRKSNFDEVVGPLTEAQVLSESSRCMTCGCRKATGCDMRDLATEYGVDPYRFSGERRRFERDTSHPDVVYEPGKCIVCDACVKVAARKGGGLTTIGRGFQVAIGTPFGDPLLLALGSEAKDCAAVCPTGALALAEHSDCDGCSHSCALHEMFGATCTLGTRERSAEQ